MTKEELYDEIVKMFPVTSYKSNFRARVDEILNDYCNCIKELDSTEQPEDWDEIVNRTNILCDAIKRSQTMELQGLRSSAFTIIKNQLDGYTNNLKKAVSGLASDQNILELPQDSVFYRMRDVDVSERRKLNNKDLFHIPLDKRGIVKTQRYSVPGYPCLYLSHTVYGCWEEMGRPNFGTIMASKFVTKVPIRVLDLRIPTKDKWNDANGFANSIKYFPLILSSMIQVKNEQDTYKPEYTLPQILTEWVIKHNYKNYKFPNKIIYGIAYTSAHINDDFNFPEDCNDNIALPVHIQGVSPKWKLCPILSKVFCATPPTYYDLEALKHNSSGIAWHNLDIDPKVDNFKTSHFGLMQGFLNYYECSEFLED